MLKSIIMCCENFCQRKTGYFIIYHKNPISRYFFYLFDFMSFYCLDLFKFSDPLCLYINLVPYSHQMIFRICTEWNPSNANELLHSTKISLRKENPPMDLSKTIWSHIKLLKNDTLSYFSKASRDDIWMIDKVASNLCTYLTLFRKKEIYAW